MKLTCKLVVILVSLMLLAILTVSFGFQLLSNSEKSNQQWLVFSKVETAKHQALSDINRHFGYGGFIHHFKNLVLRKSSEYLYKAQQSLQKTNEAIDNYLYISNDSEETAHILNFKSVVDQYSQKIDLINLKNSLEINSSIDLDMLVKVDDTDALIALNGLTESIQNRFAHVKEKTQSIMSEGKNILLIGGSALIAVLLLVMFVVVSIVMSLMKAINYNRLLFNHAPEAMLVTSDSGQILEVNHKASKLFGYSNLEFVRFNITAILPKYVHSHLRKYIDKDTYENNILKLTGSKKLFTGVSKNGKSIPIELSLIEHDTGGRKLNILTIKDLTKQEELKRASQTDHLTQLLNRRSTDLKIVGLINDIQDLPQFGMLLIDIDKFKRVNDELGHQKGDEVLQQVAGILRHMTPELGFVGRFGGEEFIMVCPYLDESELLKLAELIRLAVQQKISVFGQALTISIGLTMCRKNDSMSDLLSRADHAMYQAKNTGRNRVVIYTDSSIRESRQSTSQAG